MFKSQEFIFFQPSNTTKIMYLFIACLILGFFLGGYFSDYNYFNFTFTNYLTAIFSISLIYFSWIQNKYINLEYKLAYERSKPCIVCEISENNDFFKIQNVGDTSAFDVNGFIYNYTIDDEIEVEDIEELYSKSSKSIQFPNEWVNGEESRLGVYLNYSCDHERIIEREYSEEIQF